ncbi:hypothetical protein MNBD_GAMMA25-2156 [hydrothermal vent metagenome]|uniref:Uncharacterized protein n=1 Tax=hydrothermal vent metagenome TaxID=652676 RepID=A0A3B1BME7_9ZZZZ
MKNTLRVSVLLIASLILGQAQAALQLSTGDSFSSDFYLLDDGNYFKITDNWWDLLIDFTSASFDPATENFNLSVYEGTGLTGASKIFTSVNSTNINSLYYDFDFNFLADRTGSFLIDQVNGDFSIESVTIATFGGSSAPSNVAVTIVTPSAVPVPAAFWLFASGLVACVGLVKRKSQV